MEKEIETNTKFFKYNELLQSMNNQLNIEMGAMKDTEELNNTIREIIKKKSNNKRVPISEYWKLAKYDCPNFGLLEVFNNESSYDLEDYRMPFNPLEDASYDNCCNVANCGECWRNYINSFADAVNNSAVTVKNLGE